MATVIVKLLFYPDGAVLLPQKGNEFTVCVRTRAHTRLVYTPNAAVSLAR